MPTNLEFLETLKSQLEANLVAITASPKPSYTEDGRTVSWTEYFEALSNQLKNINDQIQRENGSAVPPKSVPYDDTWKLGQRRSPYAGDLGFGRRP